MSKKSAPRSIAPAALLAAALALGHAPPATARADASTGSSALSALPVAASAAVPVMLVTGAGAFMVVAVAVSAEGTAWVLERASDGARATIRFAGHASAAVGTAVTVTATGAGWVLSAAGTALAFVPNEIGQALLHHERVSR